MCQTDEMPWSDWKSPQQSRGRKRKKIRVEDKIKASCDVYMVQGKVVVFLGFCASVKDKCNDR